MSQVRSLRHSRWECQFHVVFIPKYRKKTIFGQIRKDLGDVMHELARQKDSRIVEGYALNEPMFPFSLDQQRCLLHPLKEDCDGKQEVDRRGPVRQAT